MIILVLAAFAALIILGVVLAIIRAQGVLKRERAGDTRGPAPKK